MEADLDHLAWGLPGVPGVPEVSNNEGAPLAGSPQHGSYEAVAATMNHIVGKYFDLVTGTALNTASVEAVLDTLEAVLITMRASTHVHDVCDFVQSLTAAVNISENLTAAPIPKVEAAGECWARPEQWQQAAYAVCGESGTYDACINADHWEPGKEDLPLCFVGSVGNFHWQASGLSAHDDAQSARPTPSQRLLERGVESRKQKGLEMCENLSRLALPSPAQQYTQPAAPGNVHQGARDSLLTSYKKSPRFDIGERPSKPALHSPGQPPLDRQSTGFIYRTQDSRACFSVVEASTDATQTATQAGDSERRPSASSDTAESVRTSALLTECMNKQKDVRGASQDRSDFLDRRRLLGTHISMAPGHAPTEIHAKMFTLLPVWDKKQHFGTSDDRVKAMDVFFHMQSNSLSDMRHSEFTVHPSQAVSDGSVSCKVPMIHPNSKKRTFWDLVSLALVIYDMIVIPLGFFDLPPSKFLSAMAWTTRIFWTIDMPASLFTGQVLEDGLIEMRFVMIARRYLRTWFALDVLINGSDWAEVFMPEAENLGHMKMGKGSRAFRSLRMIRLLRILRMGEVIKQMSERIHSEVLLILVDCAKILLCIIGVAHLIACFWYGIGVGTDSEKNWLDAFEVYHNSSLDYRYTSSLHWSLQQFSGGTDEVVPQNTPERIYAIFAWIFAYTCSTMFLGRLTFSMTRLSSLGNKQNQQKFALRKYMTQIGISRRLALRVQRNAQHAFTEQIKYLPEGNVELLKLVSEPLRMEMHFETFSPHLQSHPFFSMYVDVCPQVMMKVCHTASSVHFVSTGDKIFHAGEFNAECKMLVILKGELLYAPVYGDPINVGEDDWVSEACLWTEWVHQGVLMACNNCHICQLDARLFQDIASSFSGHEFDPRPYAKAFINELNERLQDPENGDLSDLPMGVESQIVSKLVFNSASKRNNRHAVQAFSETKSWGKRFRRWRHSEASSLGRRSKDARSVIFATQSSEKPF